MPLTRSFFTAIIGGLLNLSAAPGLAISLPNTGQLTCFDEDGLAVACAGSGQDGDTQSGVTWPAERFTDHFNETITDNLTGLMWSANTGSPGVFLYSCSPASQETLQWSQALALMSCLNARRFAGHSDWRLPNVVELQSVLDYGQADSRDWLETQGFSNIWLKYWSSTTHAAAITPMAESYVHTVSMLDGQTGIDWKESQSARFPAWPVRGGLAGRVALPKSGQLLSYLPDDDGALQRGEPMPSPRFVVLEECVEDLYSGLTWSRNANLGDGPVGWTRALAVADEVALCGHGRWRLPNVRELQSLIDYGQPVLKEHLETIGFQEVQDREGELFIPYWSATTRLSQPNNALGVRMDSATTFAFSKSPSIGGFGYVWLVSGSSDTSFEDGFESVPDSGF